MASRTFSNTVALPVTAPIAVWYQGSEVFFRVSSGPVTFVFECDERTLLEGMREAGKAYVAGLGERESNVTKLPVRHT